MGDYRRWSSGSGLDGRLRGMILIHRASIREAVIMRKATGVWKRGIRKRNCTENRENR